MLEPDAKEEEHKGVDIGSVTGHRYKRDSLINKYKERVTLMQDKDINTELYICIMH